MVGGCGITVELFKAGEVPEKDLGAAVTNGESGVRDSGRKG